MYPYLHVFYRVPVCFRKAVEHITIDTLPHQYLRLPLKVAYTIQDSTIIGRSAFRGYNCNTAQQLHCIILLHLVSRMQQVHSWQN